MAISGVGSGYGPSFLSQEDVVEVFGGGHAASGSTGATSSSATTAADTYGAGATDTGDAVLTGGAPAEALPYEAAASDSGVTDPAAYAEELASQLLDPYFVPVDAEEAIAAAQNLQALAANYDPENAAAYDGQIDHWAAVAQDALARGTRAVPQGDFFAVGDHGAVGTFTIGGQAITEEQHLAQQALVFVEKTVTEQVSYDQGESSYTQTVEVQRQTLVASCDVAAELGLSAEAAAAYCADHAAYLLPGGAVGTSEQFAAATGAAPAATDRAYLVRAEYAWYGESSGGVEPAVYGTAAQHIAAVGTDSGVYRFLPADIVAQAQQSPHGHVLLAASDQVVTVQAHLDEQALVLVRQLVEETVEIQGESSSYYTTQVERDVPMSMSQAAQQLGLSPDAAAAYLVAHTAYLLPDGSLGDGAAFAQQAGRAATSADRAYMLAGPGYSVGESYDTHIPPSYGNETQYLQAIGLDPAIARDTTISFNNSYSGGGDAWLDRSHRSFDMSAPGAFPHRAYVAIADDTLAAGWVQIGDQGPLGDDLEKMLGGLYEQYGADTPEKQDRLKSLYFRYDERFGIVANAQLIEQAVEINNNRRQGFFERGVGRAILTVAVSFIPGAGPFIAAGLNAGFALYDGASFGQALLAGAAAWAGGQVGNYVQAGASTALAGSMNPVLANAMSQGFGAVARTATTQFIQTGEIDGDSLLTSFVTGFVQGGTTEFLSDASVAIEFDRTLGLAPGTAATAFGEQLGRLASGQALSLESLIQTLGSGLAKGRAPEAVVDESGGEAVVDGAGDDDGGDIDGPGTAATETPDANAVEGASDADAGSGVLPSLSEEDMNNAALVAELRAAGYTKDEHGLETWRNPATGQVVYQRAPDGSTLAVTNGRSVLTAGDGQVVSVTGGKFNDAFAEARASGAATFEWNGKAYTTLTAEDVLTSQGKGLGPYREWAQQERAEAAVEARPANVSLDNYNRFVAVQQTNAQWATLADAGVDTAFWRDKGFTPEQVVASYTLTGNDYRLAQLGQATTVSATASPNAGSVAAAQDLSVFATDGLSPEFGGSATGQAFEGPGIGASLAQAGNAVATFGKNVATLVQNWDQVPTNVKEDLAAAGVQVVAGLLYLPGLADGVRTLITGKADLLGRHDADGLDYATAVLATIPGAKLAGVLSHAGDLVATAARAVGGVDNAVVASTHVAPLSSDVAATVTRLRDDISLPSVSGGSGASTATLPPTSIPSGASGGGVASTPSVDLAALRADPNVTEAIELAAERFGITEADFVGQLASGVPASGVLQGALVAQGVAPDVAAVLGRADDATLNSVLWETGLAEQLARISDEADPLLRQAKLDAVARHLDNGGFGTLGDKLAGLDNVFQYPAAASTGVNLNRGTGGLNDIFVASVDGQQVVVKVPKGNASAVDMTDYEAAVNLQAFGGPDVFGTVRIQVNGEWKVGFAMEQVQGIDLLSAQRAVLAGEPLPFDITGQHLEALNGFFANARAAGVRLGDVQPGDFMLTADGRVVPLDMVVSAGANTAGDEQRIVDTMLTVLNGGTPSGAAMGLPPAGAVLLGEGAFSAVYDLGNGTVLKQFLPERFANGVDLTSIASDQAQAHAALRTSFPEVVEATVGSSPGTLITAKAEGLHFGELPADLQGQAWVLATQRGAEYQTVLDEVAPGRWVVDNNAENFTYEVVNGRLQIRASFDPVGAGGQGSVLESRPPAVELPPLEFGP